MGRGLRLGSERRLNGLESQALLGHKPADFPEQLHVSGRIKTMSTFRPRGVN